MTKSNHTSAGSDCKARWGRSSDYRKKTIQGIKEKSERKDVYDNEDVLKATLSNVKPRAEISATGQIKHIASGSKAHIARYKLDKFIDGHSPYPNHAHHMIPANAFINRFNSEQKEILWQIEYDVNNGNNLIYLPSTAEATKYHYLPVHTTSDFHAPYSKEIKESATKIRDKVNKMIDQVKPCETQDPPADLVKELVNYENMLWDLIVGLGPVSINEIKIPDDNQGALV